MPETPRNFCEKCGRVALSTFYDPFKDHLYHACDLCTDDLIKLTAELYADFDIEKANSTGLREKTLCHIYTAFFSAQTHQDIRNAYASVPDVDVKFGENTVNLRKFATISAGEFSYVSAIHIHENEVIVIINASVRRFSLEGTRRDRIDYSRLDDSDYYRNIENERGKRLLSFDFTNGEEPERPLVELK